MNIEMQNLGTNKGLKEVFDLFKNFTKYLYKLKLKRNIYELFYILFILKLGFAFLFSYFYLGSIEIITFNNNSDV